MAGRVKILAEFWYFLRTSRKWWLGPILVLLVLVSALILFTESSAQRKPARAGATQHQEQVLLPPQNRRIDDVNDAISLKVQLLRPPLDEHSSVGNQIARSAFEASWPDNARVHHVHRSRAKQRNTDCNRGDEHNKGETARRQPGAQHFADAVKRIDRCHHSSANQDQS